MLKPVRSVVNPTYVASTTPTPEVGSPGIGSFNVTYLAKMSKFEFLNSEVGFHAEHPVGHYKAAKEMSSTAIGFRSATCSTYPCPGSQWFWSRKCDDSLWGQLTGGVLGDLGDHTHGLPALYVEPSPGTYYVNVPESVFSLSGIALQDMLPQIRPDLSILNDILELKDFKSLPRTFSRSLPTVTALTNRVISKVGPLWRHSKWLTLRELLRTGSDAYLQMQFNILPLYRDIQAIRRSILTINSRVQNLRERSGSPQKHFFKRFLDDIYTDEHSSTFYGVPQSTTIRTISNIRRDVVYSDRVFTGALRFNYTLDEGDGEFTLTKAFLDSLGVRLDASIIWNAIPWSFVVDWFIGIGQWLKRNASRPNLQPVTVITGLTFSLKVTRKVSVSLFPIGDATNGWPATSGGTIFESSESAYSRWLGESGDVNRGIESSGLNLKEFSLASALLLSRK
jgi:hypothetical protein